MSLPLTDNYCHSEEFTDNVRTREQGRWVKKCRVFCSAVKRLSGMVREFCYKSKGVNLSLNLDSDPAINGYIWVIRLVNQRQLDGSWPKHSLTWHCMWPLMSLNHARQESRVWKELTSSWPYFFIRSNFCCILFLEYYNFITCNRFFFHYLKRNVLAYLTNACTPIKYFFKWPLWCCEY